jgi:UDP-N-acetylglucosamine diphosphorylase/glucosamine-1-phosphate N-acetyltransferase
MHPLRICILEDAAVANLQPLTASRPAFALRCGMTSLLEKQCRYFGAGRVGAWVRPSLVALCRMDEPSLHVNDASWLEGAGEEELVSLVNGRWLPPGQRDQVPQRPEIGLAGEEVAYVALPAGQAAAATSDGRPWPVAWCRADLPRRQVGGHVVAYPWQLVEHNAEALADDFQLERAPAGSDVVPAGISLVGPAQRLRVDPSAQVEPLCLIDTTHGPVVIDRGARVQAFSRIEGPCYVGPETHVLGARLKASSLGPQCRVGGEVEASIIHGYSNKAHDGFLGHSYLGEWVNFGAGTHTSDLRTDYGAVRFWIQGQAVDSGRIKVGAFVGDHAKTSIDALLNTGSLVGPFSLLLATGGLLPRSVPAFCQVLHGRLVERTDLREMFCAAATMMNRRGRTWTAEHAEFYLQLYESTAEARRQGLREHERRMRRVV